MSSSGRIRVLLSHIVDTPEQYGGVEKMVFDVATSMPDGIDSALCVNRGELLERAVAAGVHVFPMEIRARWDLLKYSSEWGRICREYRPDIVHSWHRFPTFWAHLFRPVRYVLIHTFGVEAFDKKWLHFFGDYSTAASEGVRQHFIQHFNVRPDKIQVIYNGVDKPTGIATQGLFPEQPGKIVAAVVARLEEQKGHEYLIRALEHIPMEFLQKIHFIFVGEGSKRPLLEKMVKEKKYNNVEFAGFQSNVWPYFEMADFTLMPSLWEGFGLTIIESYLCGKPVIATNVGGIPEVVRHEETGLLVPPKDPKALAEAILRMIREPGLVKKYGEFSRIFARNFSKEKMMNEYVQLYRRLLHRTI